MSNVTHILTGVARLKRLTPFLVDLSAVGQTITISRQPSQAVALEIDLAGNTISNGTIVASSVVNTGVSFYILKDRVTGTNYKVGSTNGALTLTSTGTVASAEPVVRDTLIQNLCWRVYISNAVLLVEGTEAARNDIISLIDTVSGQYLLSVNDGVVTALVDTVVSEVFNFSENNNKRGVVVFPALAAMTVGGISGGFLSVAGINNVGQQVNQSAVIHDTLPVRFFREDGRIKMQKTGRIESGTWKIMAEPDADIRENDIIEVVSGAAGLTAGRIIWKEYLFDFAGNTLHMEAFIDCFN